MALGHEDLITLLGRLASAAHGASANRTRTFDLHGFHLGALGSGGGVTGVAVDSKGDLYVSGLTTNAALDTTVKNAHSGDIDAFVLNVKDNPAGGTIQYVTYVGTSTTDRGLGVAVDTGDDSFYVTGDTIGTLAGETKTGDVDTFAAKFDKNGILQFTHQFGGAFDHSGAAIAFDANGTCVLSRLGLPGGDIPVEDATLPIRFTPTPTRARMGANRI